MHPARKNALASCVAVSILPGAKHEAQVVAEGPEGEKVSGFVGRVHAEGREAEAALA